MALKYSNVNEQITLTHLRNNNGYEAALNIIIILICNCW
jgi:hypothetical protein